MTRIIANIIFGAFFFVVLAWAGLTVIGVQFRPMTGEEVLLAVLQLMTAFFNGLAIFGFVFAYTMLFTSSK